MPSIARRSDGHWRARYRDEEGREHARHFDRKIDAQRYLDEVTAAVVTGQYVDPRSGRTTVEEYATRWQSVQVGREATARLTDNALRLHILPRMGTRAMASIRPSDVQALVKSLSETHSPGTVRNVYERLARLFAAAVDDRVVALSPCQRIRLPRPSDEEVAPPTAEDVQRLIDAAPEHYRAAVVVLVGSGLRIGELLGLRIEDVDFLRRTLTVERQRLQSGAIGPVKSARSVRTVPLAEVVLAELAAHLQRLHGGQAPEPSAWLWLDDRARPLDYIRWKDAWERIRRDTLSAFSTHDLRHFYASALIAGGASVKQVQTLLGHSSAVITLRTYAHLWPGDDDRARGIIDEVLSDISRTPRGLWSQSERESAGQGL